ncbi:pumilio homolog 12-like [Henckelia pumila]|uniref:pumilio homolog 12-like n=1 Tax=Henckelia pumila TaxID=405737 RepID=UPI003C6E025E
MDGNIVSAGDNRLEEYFKGKVLLEAMNRLEDFKGKVLSEAMNPHGCVFLTKKLGEMIPEDIEMIYSAVKYHVGMLMVDEFGSKVIQKLFAVCEDKQMNKMVFRLTVVDIGLLTDICLDSLVSQSMQKLMDCITTQNQLHYVISAFQKIIVPLANHPIGSTVILHYYIVFPHEAEPILGLIAQHLVKIVYSETGSRLVQALISNVFTGQMRIVSRIMLNLRYMSMHRFGSEVVLHVIGLGLQGKIGCMIYCMRGCFDFMSIGEYSSNVVKKLIEVSKATDQHMIIDEIFRSPDFCRVVHNPYGYSVVQSSKEYTRGTDLGKTLDRLILQHSDHFENQCPTKNDKKRKIKKRRKSWNHVLCRNIASFLRKF